MFAGAADRDVSEFRETLNAHITVLNALRETQIEQQAEMRDFQAETREGFAKVNADMGQISALLRNLIDRG